MPRRNSSQSGGDTARSREVSPTRIKRRTRVRSEAMSRGGELFPDLDSLAKEPPSTDSVVPEKTDSSSGPSCNSANRQLLKFLVGVALAPLSLVLTESFLQAFTLSVRNGLLASQSFGCFAAGLLLFGILFAVIPRKTLMLPYVFGHEVTHALWVKLFGGKVADHFHVSLQGGHVLTDRVNTWIILSPYFFPIYSVLAATLYGVLAVSARMIDWMHEGSRLAAGVESFRWVFFLIVGMTLAFHLVFTFLLITKGQPDLQYGGTFFSLMVIYLLNLLIITALLLATSRPGTWSGYGESLARNAQEFFEFCGRAAAWLYVWIQDLRSGLGK